MGNIIATGNIPRLLQDGLNKVFGESFKRFELQWPSIYDRDTSTKNFEIDQMVEGFGAATTKPEGAGISFDSQSQGFAPKYQHVTTAKGFMVTEEALEDELYGVLKNGSRALGASMRVREETRGASVLNNGFDSAFLQPGGDGQPLFSAAHPQGPSSSGTFSNQLAVAADLSEASLEDMLILIGQATDNRGLQIQLRAEKLIIPVNLQFESQRILRSVLQNDTANNATNAIKDMGAIAQGDSVNNYLTDTNAWFIKTDAPNGMRYFTRREMRFGQDNAFTTGNMRMKADKRDSFGWSEPRGMFGTAGA